MSDPADDDGKTIWVYVDSRWPVGAKDHLKIFANIEAAERRFAEHDPEGVAFEYPRWIDSRQP
jgi:hypothetical protein